ncbi:unnamed protein product [Peronospora belbahrii]|uniref:PPM-type phosphatase domain-containing protein n=1 Tax=Peronospora belbahrii TaxID=622444 RepID=A0ABN8D4P7_9STRA|nr:unnamed protein product [Peronospora belbahrii]
MKTPGKIPITPMQGDHLLHLQRHWVSVVSDNHQLVNGMTSVSIDNIDDINDAQCLTDSKCAVVAFAGLSKKGYAPYNPRKKNQDAMVIKYDSKSQTLLLCVFDGHGEAGGGASASICDRFASELFAHAQLKRSEDLQQDEKSLQIAIADTLRSVEQSVLRDPSIHTEFSGTTAVVTVVRDNLVVDVKRFLLIINPTDRMKKRGLLLAVDECLQLGTTMVLTALLVYGWETRMYQVLPSGDAVAHTAGVMSEPEFTSRWLDENDRCLIVATDGLWEFMSNEECMEMAMGQQDPKEAVNMLIKEANCRWMREEQVTDDTTIIVAYIDTVGSKKDIKVTDN